MTAFVVLCTRGGSRMLSPNDLATDREGMFVALDRLQEWL